MKRTLMFALAAAIALNAAANESAIQQYETLVKMKSGACSFTLLDSKGVKPLEGCALILSSVKDGTPVATAKSGKDGLCVLDIAAGRYILSVNTLDLAVIDASADQKLAACRIVVRDEAMAVGGAEGDEAAALEGEGEETAPKGRLAWLTAGGHGSRALLIGGAVILVGGGYAIYENNNDDDDNDQTPGVTTVTRAPSGISRRPRRVSR